jgi:hypothetical protein
MAPIGTHCYAPFVRKLPILEVACVVGVILFVALLVAEARANGMAYKPQVSNQSLRRASLDMQPWGPAPAPNSIMTPYHALVPRQIFDAVQEGAPICVV